MRHVGHRRIHPLVADGMVQEANRTWSNVHHKVFRRYTMRWHDVLPFILSAMRSHCVAPPGDDVYVFGVAIGEGLPMLHQIFPTSRLFGFDSFKGLPSEQHAGSRIAGWGEGKFHNTRLDLNKLVRDSGGEERVRLVSGFFNESLSPALVGREAMRPARYVDIDCDLHVSSVDALGWLFANGLVRVGTLIGYDDWWTISCYRFHHVRAERTSPHWARPYPTAAYMHSTSPLDVGEGRAHRQMVARYGIRFVCVAGPCKPSAAPGDIFDNWAPVFLVAAIGEAADHVSHGFEFGGPADERRWMRESSPCMHVG
jgi:hypothetical protein